jgi:hypothetical protein
MMPTNSMLLITLAALDRERGAGLPDEPPRV